MPPTSALLTDLYQLAMVDVYVRADMTNTAVFELFFRKLPPTREFLMAAGLEQALQYLEALRFTLEDIAFLRETGQFGPEVLDYLRDFRFTGDVDAMPEGTVFFPDEPVLRVTAPLPQAQLVETRLINLLHFQTVVASKAARMVLAAPGKPLIDFGLRRAHGAEAGLLAARASYLAGFAGTATIEAGRLLGIPVFGTMAHSFIQAHSTEGEAFERFARMRPDNVILLIDTYDTERAARRVCELAQRLQPDGIAIKGVRIDCDPLDEHARKVRGILDAAGLQSVRIIASGGLDEQKLLRFQQEGAPIDTYGIGTSLTTSSDAPALDCAYKLQEYDGIPRRKRSGSKATWPGRRQVWRVRNANGHFLHDTVSTATDQQEGDTLLKPVMRNGKRLYPPPTINEIRTFAQEQLAHLPPALARLESASYPISIAPALRQVAEACDRAFP